MQYHFKLFSDAFPKEWGGDSAFKEQYLAQRKLYALDAVEAAVHIRVSRIGNEWPELADHHETCGEATDLQGRSRFACHPATTTCDADGSLFRCQDPACNLERKCATNSSLNHCACPLDIREICCPVGQVYDYTKAEVTDPNSPWSMDASVYADKCCTAGSHLMGGKPLICRDEVPRKEGRSVSEKIGVSPSNSLEECMAACEKLKSCTGFAYIKDGKDCHLKKFVFDDAGTWSTKDAFGFCYAAP